MSARADRGVYRRRRAGVVGLTAAVLVVLIALAYAGIVLARPAPAAVARVPASATAAITTPAVTPAWPADGSAAIALVGRSGLLGEHGSEASVPIASMTKTITALVIAQKYHLDAAGEAGPTITFGDRDVAILHQVWAEGGSWATVQAGEKLTTAQALTAMLLPSANNYARSLAVWAAGSQRAFVAQANSWLKQHGFTHTTMTDPSGFDSGSVSNMRDLVGIGELVMANPALAKIVGTAHTTLPVVGELDNTNQLLGSAGIVGVKTGWTDQAGHCLLFASRVTIDGVSRTFVGVLLGQPDYDALWGSVPKLLASFERGFHTVDLTDAGATVFADYRTAWGQSTTLVAATRPTRAVYGAHTITARVDARDVRTVAAGAKAGTVTYTDKGRKTTVALTAVRAITGPSFWWKLTHPNAIF